MMGLTNDKEVLGRLQSMMSAANRAGVATENAGQVINSVTTG